MPLLALFSCYLDITPFHTPAYRAGTIHRAAWIFGNPQLSPWAMTTLFSLYRFIYLSCGVYSSLECERTLNLSQTGCTKKCDHIIYPNDEKDLIPLQGRINTAKIRS